MEKIDLVQDDRERLTSLNELQLADNTNLIYRA